MEKNMFWFWVRVAVYGILGGIVSSGMFGVMARFTHGTIAVTWLTFGAAFACGCCLSAAFVYFADRKVP